LQRLIQLNHKIRLIQDGKRLFTAIPNRRSESDDFKNIVHPINYEFRKMPEQLIAERDGIQSELDKQD